MATSFNVVGPGLTLAAGQDLVFYNLGPLVDESNAYAPNSSAAQQATSNRRSATSTGTVTTVISSVFLVAFQKSGSVNTSW